jgi:Domain of unknown function (DUF1942)
MRTTTIASAAVAPLAVAAVTIATAATASAADPTVAGFGAREQLYDGGGAVIAGWTISDLRPSSDAIPYPVAGKLYEATATVEAGQGGVTPIVSNFNARAADGGTYRALYSVATAQGVNPSTLPPGGKTTGKVYFDVTGANPNSVVYNDTVQDLLIWTGGAAASAPAAPAPSPAAAPAPGAPAPAAAAPAAPAPATPAPTTAATPAPLPAASGSMPSGTSPAGGSITGVTGTSAGSAGSGGNPAGGSTTGVTGVAPGSAGPGGNPAGKT